MKHALVLFVALAAVSSFEMKGMEGIAQVPNVSEAGVASPGTTLNVSISGPNWPSGGEQTWTANVTGGTEPISYVWEYKDVCDQDFHVTGVETSTYTLETTSGEYFFLRVTASSGGDSDSHIKHIGGFHYC